VAYHYLMSDIIHVTSLPTSYFCYLILSPRKAEKPASRTITNSRKVEIPACRSLNYSRKAEISAWKFNKNC